MVNRIDPQRTQTLQINGMKCTECVSQVEQALRALTGVENVEVDLGEGVAMAAACGRMAPGPAGPGGRSA